MLWGALLCTQALLVQVTFATSYDYDDLGRLIEVIYDSGRKVTYDYDPAGNRTEHVVEILGELPIKDNIPTLGIGNNLINLDGWPVGEAPAGNSVVPTWRNYSTFVNETRWTRVTGPGESQKVTVMEAGQTETDNNGGGNYTHSYTIDRTRGYEFSIYFRKYDLAVQNIYLGMSISKGVELLSNGIVTTNPYFMAWNTSAQSAYLDPDKWYKAVGYIFPEGYPKQSNSVSGGGVFDVATGTKIANLKSFRWNENSTATSVNSRFFTYYSQTVQNRFTSYFYQPEVRQTKISYTPAVPVISASHSNATEGSNVIYTVSLSAATTVDVKVNYVVGDAGGSNSASSADYSAISGTLTILEGQTQGTLSVPTNSDSLFEANEGIKLTLSSPVRATIGSGQSTEVAYIVDDGQGNGASFSVNNVSINEGGNLTFTVTKKGNTPLTHNVSYATANNSATSGDYTTNAGTLNFTSSQTSKKVTVSTKGDSTYENNETLYLNLSGATNGATISDNQGVGTITNNDSAPSFSFMPTVDGVSVAEGGSLTFRVTKSGATAYTHNVNYATANGSASKFDYTSKSGTLSFTSSQTSKTVTVTTKGDSTYENNETLYLNLSGATNGATISDSQDIGVITNNDAAPAFKVNNVSVNEGGTLTFTVTKSGSTSKTHNISYSTANGTASSSSDYTAKSGTLSFTSTQTTKTVSVPTTGDSTYESNETVKLNLSSATSGATISDSQGVGTINNDDINSPPVAVNDFVSTSNQREIRIYPLQNDSDPDGDTLTITSVDSPNCFVYDGRIVECFFASIGTRTRNYTISDGNGNTDTARIAIRVTGGGGEDIR